MNLDTKFHPQTILCVAAHPDDLEAHIGGSVAKWAKAGANVFYLVCTDGSKGTTDRHAQPAELIKTRRDEQRAAAEILGVKEVSFLDYEDGCAQVTQDLKLDIVREIRRRQPDVVYCIDPTMIYSEKLNYVNHTDHRAIGQATLDAVFPLARDHLSFPQLIEEGLEPHKTRTLLLGNYDRVNFAVDISDVFDIKVKALAAHASQFHDVETSEAYIRKMAVDLGKDVGVKLVEGFVRLDLPA